MIKHIASDNPNHFDMRGRIEKTGTSEITIPPYSIKIDNNSYIQKFDYVLDLSLDINFDNTLSSLTLGDNIYIYACKSTDNYPDIVFSKNSTFPDHTLYTGEVVDENNSRKIGGFHYGRIRATADAFNDNASIDVNIVSNSVWSLNYRPACDPTGMVKVSNFWADIYIASEGSGTWPETELVSEYNATPVSGTEGYNDYDFIRGLANVNKRKLTRQEWLMAAYGSPEGHDGDNNAAWSLTSNSGRTATGTVEQAVSCYNLVDCAGNLWERLDEYTYRNTGSTSFAWHDVLNAGKDSSYQHGEAYMQSNVGIVGFLAGGVFSDGGICGARAVYSNNNPWSVGADIGVRGACAHQSA